MLITHERGEVAWPQANLRAAVYNAPAPSFAATENSGRARVVGMGNAGYVSSWKHC